MIEKEFENLQYLIFHNNQGNIYLKYLQYFLMKFLFYYYLYYILLKVKEIK
jgi:hypothetical protein